MLFCNSTIYFTANAKNEDAVSVHKTREIMQKPNRRGLLLILSSPSGAGKSTFSKKLIAWDNTIQFSVSATTRLPRVGELEGRDYYFTKRHDFEQLVEAGKMLEYAEVFGNLYGSPLKPVQEAMSMGRDTLFDVDWQGGQQIKGSALGGDVVSVFILPPSIKELERRLKMRAQDSDIIIAERMAKSADEISHWAEYDYVLVNDDIEKTFSQLVSIVQAERLRRVRQITLPEFLRNMIG